MLGCMTVLADAYMVDFSHECVNQTVLLLGHFY